MWWHLSESSECKYNIFLQPLLRAFQFSTTTLNRSNPVITIKVATSSHWSLGIHNEEMFSYLRDSRRTSAGILQPKCSIDWCGNSSSVLLFSRKREISRESETVSEGGKLDNTNKKPEHNSCYKVPSKTLCLAIANRKTIWTFSPKSGGQSVGRGYSGTLSQQINSFKWKRDWKLQFLSQIKSPDQEVSSEIKVFCTLQQPASQASLILHTLNSMGTAPVGSLKAQVVYLD